MAAKAYRRAVAVYVDGDSKADARAAVLDAARRRDHSDFTGSLRIRTRTFA
jgi:hypothetical protein